MSASINLIYSFDDLSLGSLLSIPIELSRSHRTLDLSVDGAVSHVWRVSTEPNNSAFVAFAKGIIKN